MHHNEYMNYQQQTVNGQRALEMVEYTNPFDEPVVPSPFVYTGYQNFPKDLSQNYISNHSGLSEGPGYRSVNLPDYVQSPTTNNGFAQVSPMQMGFPPVSTPKGGPPSRAYPMEPEYMPQQVMMYHSNPKSTQEVYSMQDQSRSNGQMQMMFVPQYQHVQAPMGQPVMPVSYFNPPPVPFQKQIEQKKEKTLNANDLSNLLKDDFDDLDEFYQKYENDKDQKQKVSDVQSKKQSDKPNISIKENFGDLSAIQTPNIKKIESRSRTAEPTKLKSSDADSQDQVDRKDSLVEQADDGYELPNDSVYIPFEDTQDESAFVKDSKLLNAPASGMTRQESKASMIGHSILINVNDPIELEMLERQRRENMGGDSDCHLATDSTFEPLPDFSQYNEQSNSMNMNDVSEIKPNFKKIQKKEGRVRNDIENEYFEELNLNDISEIPINQEKRIVSNRYKPAKNAPGDREVDLSRQDGDDNKMVNSSRPVRHHARNKEKIAEERKEDGTSFDDIHFNVKSTTEKSEVGKKKNRIEINEEGEAEQVEEKFNSRYSQNRPPRNLPPKDVDDDRPLTGAPKTFEEKMEEALAKEALNGKGTSQPKINPRAIKSAQIEVESDDPLDRIPVKQRKPFNRSDPKESLPDDEEESIVSKRNISKSPIRPKSNIKKEVTQVTQEGVEDESQPTSMALPRKPKESNQMENSERELPGMKNTKDINRMKETVPETIDRSVKSKEVIEVITSKPSKFVKQVKLTKIQKDQIDWLRVFSNENSFISENIDSFQSNADFWPFLKKVKEASQLAASEPGLQDTITQLKSYIVELKNENSELSKKIEGLTKENELAQKANPKNTTINSTENDQSINDGFNGDKEKKSAKNLESKPTRREQQENDALRLRIKRLEDGHLLKETGYKDLIQEQTKQLAELNAKLSSALGIKDGRSPSAQKVRKPISTTTTVSQRNVSPIKANPKTTSTTNISNRATSPIKKAPISVNSSVEMKSMVESSSKASIKTDLNQAAPSNTNSQENSMDAKDKNHVSIEGLKLNDSKKKYFSKKKERLSTIKESVVIIPTVINEANVLEDVISAEVNVTREEGHAEVEKMISNDSGQDQVTAQNEMLESREEKTDENSHPPMAESQIRTSDSKDKLTIAGSRHGSKGRLADLSSIVHDTLLTDKLKEHDIPELEHDSEEKAEQEEEPNVESLPDPKRLTRLWDNEKALVNEVFLSFVNPLPIAKIFSETVDKDSYHYKNNKFYKEYARQQKSNRSITKTNNLADGKVHNFFDNRVQEIIFANGSKREIYPDGYTIVFFINGDIKQTLPDSTIVYYYTEHDTTQTTLPDGLADVGLLDIQIWQYPSRVSLQKRKQRDKVY
jgi:hypothetical protein